jgi:hypothetical protein
VDVLTQAHVGGRRPPHCAKSVEGVGELDTPPPVDSDVHRDVADRPDQLADGDGQLLRTAGKTRTDTQISVTGDDRGSQMRNICRVVGPVRIHEHDHWLLDQRQAGADRGPLARARIEVDLRTFGTCTLDGGVGGVAVHHHHPAAESARPGHCLSDGPLFILCQDHRRHRSQRRFVHVEHSTNPGRVR